MTLTNSTEILCQFPEQVDCLKGTADNALLSGRSKNLAGRLISPSFTADFKQLCDQRARLLAGDTRMIEAIANHQAVAKDHMDRVNADLASVLENYAEMEKACFSPADVRELRSSHKYTAGLTKSISVVSALVGADFVQKFLHLRKAPLPGEFRNTYQLRFALCITLLMVHWMELGSQMDTKPAKTVNDLIDMHFAAYATFFDGLLTRDAKQKRLYREARAILGRNDR